MAPSRVIAVPKTDPGAYNPSRPAGKLLLAQVAHLREALTKHSREIEGVLAVDVGSLKTEGDVSAFIEKATAILHPGEIKRPRGQG
jgi:hypothetical protein